MMVSRRRPPFLPSGALRALTLGVVGFAAAALVGAGCSDDPQANAPDAAADGSPAQNDATTVPTDAGTELSVTPAGATFNVGGATITFPPGAVAAETKIALRLTSEAPKGTGLAGGVVATDILVATPHGTRFNAPVVVELPAKASGAGTPTIMTLTDDSDTTWEPLTTAKLANGRLRFETMHFSWLLGYYTPPTTDAGTEDAGPKQTPQCATFVTGTTKNDNAPITIVGDRAYWFGVVDGAGSIHTAKTDLTDHKTFAGQGGVPAISANATGVFWFNNSPPQGSGNSPGLYRLASPAGTPTLQAPLQGFPSLLAAAPSNVFFVTTAGAFDRALVRASADGQNNETMFTGGFLPDSLLVFGGYVYWRQSTVVANPTFCQSSKMVAVNRLPLGAPALTAPETVVDACDLLDATSAEAGVAGFTVVGNDYYLQTNRGMKIWKGSLSGGKPTKLHEPAFGPKTGGAEVLAVGNKLVFSEVNTVSTPDNGLRTINLSTAAVGPIFAAPYTFKAGDATHVYFAGGGGLCRLAVPQ